MHKPAYFESIRSKAAGSWDKLDNDPELAGPWHQLFKQVQNPRHVISELLQNADDADATEASVEIRDGEFIFAHNGKDFTEEQFASLCRFGYSNKRTLHTIGFRGIGFKSTFSLGDKVRIHTPTLSVIFERKRFTEPVWSETEGQPAKQTEVRIKIKNQTRAEALHKNLSEWQDSATSLLFFRHIRSLRIDDKDIRWIAQGPGPAPGTEWVALSTAPGKKYLKIHSVEEPFPEDALTEIRQERMVFADEDMEFPPCSLDLIMGIAGALFVVLPTGVETKLPFACNAPFLQDPARTGIKDPSVSPTNRWLLERAGRLAASTLLAWLRRDDLSPEERCEAYDLLCDVNRSDNTLEGQCGQIGGEAFGNAIKGQAIILTVDGILHSRLCRSVPKELHSVWTPAQLKALFARSGTGILCRHVRESDLRKLSHWNLAEKVEKQKVLEVMETASPPRPDSWAQLSILWDYLSPELARNYFRAQYKGAKIFPVRGQDRLHAASDVTRLGEKKALQSDEDWRFLEQYLRVLDSDWIGFLGRQLELGERNEDAKAGERARSSMAVLEEFGLDRSTTADDFIEQVAAKMFSGPTVSLEDHIRIAQIAATLGARPQGSFRFMTQDGASRSLCEHVLVDLDGDLDLLLDSAWCAGHILHNDYFGRFSSCTEYEWQDWFSSGKSGLSGFPILESKVTETWYRGNLATLFPGRGGTRATEKEYVSDRYALKDWDFERIHWDYWRGKAKEDETFWWKILRKIMNQPLKDWGQNLEAIGYQVCERGRGKGNRSRVAWDMAPTWIMNLSEVPCVKDKWGHFLQPADVMRRTPQTEAFLEVEPFIAAEYDTETIRPILIALGLRDTPAGPEKILERLEALSESSRVILEEIGRWYARLDSLAQKSSTEELEKIRQSFSSKKLILAEGLQWALSSEVHLGAGEDDIPGTLQIHPAFNHLSLWQRIGVADRPTAELAIGWLKSLQSNQKLEPPELARVTSVARRFPNRVWIECGHWPSIEGIWTPVGELEFGARRTSASLLDALFASIGQNAADFRFLSEKDLAKEPFSNLRDLSESVEERISGYVSPDSRSSPCVWLNVLGSELSHIALENDDETRRVNSLGVSLANTQWKTGKSIEATPHIDGIPVGEPRSLDILWDGSVLYTLESNAAKLARIIAQEIGKAFQRSDIKEAVSFCYERSDDFIREYISANFAIAETVAPPVETGDMGISAVSGEPGSPLTMGIITKNADVLRATIGEVGAIPIKGDTTALSAVETSFEAEDEENQPGRRRARQEKEPLITRFALAAGFVKEGEGFFVHSSGKRIERAKDDIFPWRLCDSSGDLIRFFWVQERCIRRRPIEIEAEVWAKLRSDKNRCSLILCDEDDGPVELSGADLIGMVAKKEVVVHISSYRLVSINEHAD